ncbi:hypothetical protein ACVI1J_005579 [Bradyrhizobium diazoefficiens]
MLFSSIEQRREFISKMSGSLEGSYAGAGGAISASREIQDELKRLNVDKTVKLAFETRAAVGTRGVGSAISTLASAEGAPFETAWKAMGELVKGLTDDQGRAVSTTFTPIDRLIAGNPLPSFSDRLPRAGPGCLDSAPLDLSGFLPGYAERGALRFCRCVGRA